MDEIENKETSLIERDIPQNIETIMQNAYLQYSLSVNIGRAIPDVRDGLKPGNRRILYAMRQLGLTKSHAYTKCAKVVGEVIGNYHPHGDQSVYDTLVRMAQDFSMRHPLIDGQGNFGSIDGDSPAAYRYTECRMERLAEELLADLDKNTVDMRPTFDESTMEPTVLPAGFPNLLVMGGTGIGVGMATNIPPHNLREVIDATIHLIDKPYATFYDLMKHIPGPDFPGGAAIHGLNPIKELYETGHGIIKIRGKSEIIETASGAEQILITELPYTVNKERLILKVADLVKDGQITGISAINDISSSRVGIKIVVDIKRNAFANVVLNHLYKHTPLELIMGCQFMVVDHNRPKQLTLKQVLEAYIDHRYEVMCRRNQFDLEKAQARSHIVEGLLIAVENIDEVIKIIRASRTKDLASIALMERFQFSKKQTSAILEMRMHQLTGLAIDELSSEFNKLKEKIDYLESLLASRELTLDVLKNELIIVRDKYSDPRRTLILPSETDINIADLIPKHISVITISNVGYIKRMNVDEFKTQNRGGKGVMGMQTRDEDYVKHLFTGCSHDYILFFSNIGKMHWLKVYEIPEASRISKGKAMINLLDLEEGEYVRAMITVDKLDVDSKYVVMSTRNGIIKKTELRAFKHLRKKPIRAITLIEGDDLIEVTLTDGLQNIILSSAYGKACRFNESGIRVCGRTAQGVRGIRLVGEDHVVAMSVTDSPSDNLFVITAHGIGKRSRVGTGISLEDKEFGGGYRVTKRAGKGVTSIKLGENDQVVEVLRLTEETDILITTVNGQTVRISTEQVRAKKGRATRGVRVMSLKEGDKISGVSKIQDLKDEDLDEDLDDNQENEDIETQENIESAETNLDSEGKNIESAETNLDSETTSQEDDV